MNLTDLKLHNFGVYAGLQIFDFSPANKDRSVSIVGALNGAGKTTLLTAIQLVLYGPLSPSAKSAKGGYEEFLRSKINRSCSPSDGASVQLDFKVFDDEGERLYSVRRFWKEGKSGKVQEELVVFIDNEANKFLTQNWAEHIEALLPSRIMPLFFFDGEKIEELANEDNTSAILSSAVNGLLGLDLVEQLTSDLGVFEFRKAKLIASKNELIEIEAAQNKLKILEDNRAILRQKRAAHVAKLEWKTYENLELKTEYSAQGGDFFESREDLKLERSNALSRFSEHAEVLAKIAEAGAPLLLVRELLDEVTFQSDIEEISEKAEAVLELISVHDRKTIGKLTELGVESKYVDDLSAHLSSERLAHEKAAHQERYLEISENGRARLHSLNKSVLTEISLNISNGLEVNTELADDVDQLEKNLLAVPDDEVIAPFLLAVEESELALATIKEQISHADAQIHEVGLTIDSAARELRLQMSQSIDAQLESDDTIRFLKHSEKVKKTLDAFKQKTLQRKLRQIEVLILDCFNDLTRKSQLISDLTIEPNTFQMYLKGSDSEEIKTSDLSSGERQLLATSILWGLSKASQREIPAIIDTPLGRLDSSHRETLCAKYFPKASHQVILLSTDEEVDERYLEILQPSINKTYRVEFDSNNGGSAVREGYLF